MGTAKTRKNKHVLTIPQLRRSFHAVESYLTKEIRAGKKQANELTNGFRKEWKKHFRRDLNVAAARSYITHIREKIAKGFRGGYQTSSQLSAAPLDMTTRPGVYGQYGNFLDYVGTGFWNPEPGIKGDPGFTVVVPKDMGSNQAGGKRKQRGTRKQRGGLNPLTGAPYAAEFRPFVAQTPQTFQASIQDSIKGIPPPPSADPIDPAFQYKMSPHNAQPPGIDVAGLDRNLLKDVSVPY